MQPNASPGLVLIRRAMRMLLYAFLCSAIYRALPAFGQSTAVLTIDDVVAKLQSNLDFYDKSIPAFLADERIDSYRHDFAARGASAPNYETIAESVFRLKRGIDPADSRTILEESRDIRIIDGKPANGRKIDAPTMLSGAFSGGLAVVSQDEKPCMRYELEAVKPHRPIVVRFVTVPVAQRPKDCILAEDGSGRVTIDPASMQISRIDIRVTHHLLTPFNTDGSVGDPTVTRWDVHVNYKPVVLGARTFWLPETISSLCINNETEWSFTGMYRNYHLLEVHSRVLIPNDATQ